jgi:hypothetical protein
MDASLTDFFAAPYAKRLEIALNWRRGEHLGDWAQQHRPVLSSDDIKAPRRYHGPLEFGGANHLLIKCGFGSAADVRMTVAKIFGGANHLLIKCGFGSAADVRMTVAPTNIVEGREQRIWKMPPGPERAKLRSRTFAGVAEAMAEQWCENTQNPPLS